MFYALKGRSNIGQIRINERHGDKTLPHVIIQALAFCRSAFVTKNLQPQFSKGKHCKIWPARQNFTMSHEKEIQYVDVDKPLKNAVAEQWKEHRPDIGSYLHLEKGYGVAAMDGEKVVGILSVKWQSLSAPLTDSEEAFIEAVDVLGDYRRQGIATRLIEEAETRALEKASQLRSWCSEEQREAIQMFKVLGFGMCPASGTCPHTGKAMNGYFAVKAIASWMQ